MLTKKPIAWCDLGTFYDGEYKGPMHPCPANPDCNDGTDHYLKKRAALVCDSCGWAYVGFTKAQLKGFECYDCGTVFE